MSEKQSHATLIVWVASLVDCWALRAEVIRQWKAPPWRHLGVVGVTIIHQRAKSTFRGFSVFLAPHRRVLAGAWSGTSFMVPPPSSCPWEEGGLLTVGLVGVSRIRTGWRWGIDRRSAKQRFRLDHAYPFVHVEYRSWIA